MDAGMGPWRQEKHYILHWMTGGSVFSEEQCHNKVARLRQHFGHLGRRLAVRRVPRQRVEAKAGTLSLAPVGQLLLPIFIEKPGVCASALSG